MENLESFTGIAGKIQKGNKTGSCPGCVKTKPEVVPDVSKQNRKSKSARNLDQAWPACKLNFNNWKEKNLKTKMIPTNLDFPADL